MEMLKCCSCVKIVQHKTLQVSNHFMVISNEPRFRLVTMLTLPLKRTVKGNKCTIVVTDLVFQSDAESFLKVADKVINTGAWAWSGLMMIIHSITVWLHRIEICIRHCILIEKIHIKVTDKQMIPSCSRKYMIQTINKLLIIRWIRHVDSSN